MNDNSLNPSALRHEMGAGVARILASLIQQAASDLELSQVMMCGDFWEDDKVGKLSQLIRAFSNMEKFLKGEPETIEGRIDEAIDNVMLARYLSMRLEEAGDVKSSLALKNGGYYNCPHCKRGLFDSVDIMGE